MCGIAGFELSAGAERARADSLLDSLSRRGPDGGWAVDRPPYCLVQTRLAVIDLSDRVVYPMPNEKRDVWLLFNGEIYAHDQLRRELEARGHRFSTACDAEVVVHAYEEWGAGCFARLDGMFAVAILDERRRELLLARDRFGIKPLARTISGPFAFSSDAMGLVRAGLSGGRLDEVALRQYTAFHYVPPPRTGIEGVRDVEPGTLVRRGFDGREEVERWAPRTLGEAPPGAPVPAEALERALRESVARQLVADVPVGIFLSSGVDSALALAYAVDAGARPMAFTIGFGGAGDYDETPAAAATASALGVPHQYEQFDMGFGDAMDLVARAFDRPFADSSAIATLALARLARGSVTVALSGTGGDDLFAGYYRYRAHKLRGLVSLLPRPLLARIARGDALGGAERRSGLTALRFYAARLLQAGTEDPTQQYLSLVGNSTTAGLEALRLPLDLERARAEVAAEHHLRAPRDAPLRALQQFDLDVYLPGDLMVKEDRATMSVGLEGRVPLLGMQVADVAARTPDRQKLGLAQGKRLLREVAQRRLGKERISPRKRGFAVPLGPLFESSWRGEAADWLGSSASALVDGEQVRSLLLERAIPAAQLWALAALIAWEGELDRARSQGLVLRGEDARPATLRRHAGGSTRSAT